MFDHNGEPVPTARDSVRRWFARNIGLLITAPLLGGAVFEALRVVWS